MGGHETPQQKTEALLEELVALIRKATQPEQAPLSRWGKTGRFLGRLVGGIKAHWAWLSIAGLLAACMIYGFNPFYKLREYKIAADESLTKIAAMEQKKTLIGYYMTLGDTMLNAGKTEEAARAFDEAKKLDSTNLSAEYGYRKTLFLSFSEEQAFDPVVAKARLDVVTKLAPSGIDVLTDPHIIYARAFLMNRTDPSRTDDVVKMLGQNPNHSPSLRLLGDIALSQGNIEAGIDYYQKAQTLSPDQWDISNNLAYAYNLQADHIIQKGDLQTGWKIITQKVWPLYQNIITLDPELVTPHVEMVRLNALLSAASGKRDLQTQLIIDQIEGQNLQDLPKNKGNIAYTFMDESGKSRCPVIYSWKAKKAYLCQLQCMMNYLDDETPVSKTEGLCQTLSDLRQTSIDGRMCLPLLLKNDLQTLALYNPQWVKGKKVAEKINRLMAYTTPEYH